MNINALINFLVINYIFLGVVFLIFPLIFIEISKPKDLLKGGLMILVGLFLLFERNTFNSNQIIIFYLNALLFYSFFFEACTNRWNQLLDKEKLKFKNLEVMIKKLLIFLDGFQMGLKTFFSNFKQLKLFEKTKTNKKWVRSSAQKDLATTDKESLNSSISKVGSTNSSKKDIISVD